jgi:hypothetical protein
MTTLVNETSSAGVFYGEQIMSSLINDGLAMEISRRLKENVPQKKLMTKFISSTEINYFSYRNMEGLSLYSPSRKS